MRGLKVRQGGDGWRGARALVLLAAVGGALAQPKPTPSGIYTCIDDKGKRITSDRPIAECTGKEQRVLNKDGSLKAVYPPTLTADERAEKEAKERKDAEARAAQADAVRRDRNLKARYPTRNCGSRTSPQSVSRCSTKPSSTSARRCRPSCARRWTRTTRPPTPSAVRS
jgi:hypothetical protein